MDLLRLIKKLVFNLEPELDKRYLKTFYKLDRNIYKHSYNSVYRILDHHRKVKIGKSGDAIIRKSYNDYKGNYSKMYLLARSKNPELISRLEKDCIKKFYNENENISRASGGKMRTYNGFYYLYVVAY